MNGLAELIGPILVQCNETDDFAPATHLMQISFTLYHESETNLFDKFWLRVYDPLQLR
ncbi:unnamed protein product [Echinostoma caproni]|uniref:Uncharacterized protein n=1 Tax=Echinostoma caproni TaxID=27848 RepID=A0A3P8LCR3_9TREM|nr:unnamed protein product [Echinostoma caproni]